MPFNDTRFLLTVTKVTNDVILHPGFSSGIDVCLSKGQERCSPKFLTLVIYDSFFMIQMKKG